MSLQTKEQPYQLCLHVRQCCNGTQGERIFVNLVMIHRHRNKAHAQSGHSRQASVVRDSSFSSRLPTIDGVNFSLIAWLPLPSNHHIRNHGLLIVVQSLIKLMVVTCHKQCMCLILLQVAIFKLPFHPISSNWLGEHNGTQAYPDYFCALLLVLHTSTSAYLFFEIFLRSESWRYSYVLNIRAHCDLPTALGVCKVAMSLRRHWSILLWGIFRGLFDASGLTILGNLTNFAAKFFFGSTRVCLL